MAVLASFPLASGCMRRENAQQRYSESLLVAPAAIKPTFHVYPDGRQQVIYAMDTPYPADEVLAFLKIELQKRGWKALSESFFNPGLPSGIERGWTSFEDHTRQPWTGVFAWSADWENSSHDITEYVLQYKSPKLSTYDLKDLEVIAIYIPANIAARSLELQRQQLAQPKK
jgi:hypothetical protein